MSADLISEVFRATVSRHVAEAGVEGADWLRDLPRLVDECVAQWDVQVTGPSMFGVCALVLPVRRDDGSPAVLKVSWPHPEAAHEHLALRRWDGDGAVRLLAADPSRWAMLLEALDPACSLLGEPIDQACTAIGQLLRQLDVPALPQSVRLSDQAVRWAGELDAAATGSAPDGAGPPLPPRFLRQARDLCLDLARSPDVDARLVHSDLHYENVLGGADRQQWLAIDPKPLAGEPAFAVTPLLWNRWGEAVAGGKLRRHLRRRLDLACDAAGIDRERAMAWSIVREAVNALWEVEAPGPDTAAVLSAKVATIKALQPD